MKESIPSDGILALLASFPRLPLKDAMAIDLNTRTDLKFLIPISQLTSELESRSHAFIVQENACGAPCSDYLTRYWEYPDGKCFRDHALDRNNRFKIRKRLYQDTGDCLFEIKKKSGNLTIKLRNPSSFNHELNGEDVAFLEKNTIPTIGLAPFMDVHYQRITLWSRELNGRVSVDLDFSFSKGSAQRSFQNIAILELKGDRRFIRKTLRTFTIPLLRYQTSFSKYALANVAAMGYRTDVAKELFSVHKRLLKLNSTP